MLQAETVRSAKSDRSVWDFVIARHMFRRSISSGLLWGTVFGVFVASSAFSYASVYGTQADRNKLAATFGANVSTSALFGPGLKLNTVTGYTAFHIWLTIAIIGGVWGISTSTKLLRGGEDSGAWELLLAGRTTRRNATAESLLGFTGVVFVAWLVTAAITVGSGRAPQFNVSTGPALFLALTLVSTALMFMAVGAFTSQIGASRRQAATYAGWILGASYAIRMVADSGTGLHWLIWVSPLGWVEEFKPLTYPDFLPLVPVLCFTVAVGGISVVLAARRDLGGAILGDKSHAMAHFALLESTFRLAIRMLRPVLVTWGSAVTLTGLLLGYVAYTAGQTLSNSSLNGIYAKLGASGAGVKVFLGVSFIVLAVMVAFAALGQVAAIRLEEAEGRLEQLLSQPVTRTRWLAGRLGIAVADLFALGILGGTAAWVGVAFESNAVSFASLFAAGLNVVAPALCIFGAAILTYGVLPRATAVVGYGLFAWSLLVEFIGGIGAMNKWLFDTSLFHHMAVSPAVPPNVTSDLSMMAIGLIAATIGCVAFSRRDIQGR